MRLIRESKVLVNVSTNAIHDFVLSGGWPAYGLTKNSGTLAIQLIAKDVQPEDMQVVSFNPGFVFTDMVSSQGFTEDSAEFDTGEFSGVFL